MLVLLPSSMRRDGGVAFVAALPLIPPDGVAVDAVELRPDGTMNEVITLHPAAVDTLHDTTTQALEAATPQMHRTADELDRFALRPGITLGAAVDAVNEARRIQAARQQPPRPAPGDD